MRGIGHRILAVVLRIGFLAGILADCNPMVTWPLCRRPQRAANAHLTGHPMKSLSIGVALFGLVALFVAASGQDAVTAVLGAAALLCAFTTFRSAAISSFL